MVLWIFDGNMVGKWINEPCNGVDEVVNLFWVLTTTVHYPDIGAPSVPPRLVDHTIVSFKLLSDS